MVNFGIKVNVNITENKRFVAFVIEACKLVSKSSMNVYTLFVHGGKLYQKCT